MKWRTKDSDSAAQPVGRGFYARHDHDAGMVVAATGVFRSLSEDTPRVETPVKTAENPSAPAAAKMSDGGKNGGHRSEKKNQDKDKARVSASIKSMPVSEAGVVLPLAEDHSRSPVSASTRISKVISVNSGEFRPMGEDHNYPSAAESNRNSKTISVSSGVFRPLDDGHENPAAPRTIRGSKIISVRNSGGLRPLSENNGHALESITNRTRKITPEGKTGGFRILGEDHEESPPRAVAAARSSVGSAPGGESGRHASVSRPASVDVSVSNSGSAGASVMSASPMSDQRLILRPATRPGSPETSSNGSTYNLSDTSAEGGLRATPMGSTTGLIDNGSVHSGFKVGCRCLPGLGSTLAALSLAAGLGNTVRLPRVVFLNGGGPFLLVYICITIILGIPLVFLEIGLGQFCQDGTTKLWRAVPLFKGVGYVKILASVLLALYYPVIMTISLFYMVWCIKGPLPFTECTHTFTNGNDYTINTGEVCLQDTFLKPYDEDFMWFGVNIAFLFLLWALTMLCIFKNKHSYRVAAFFALIPVLLCLTALLIEAMNRDLSTKALKKITSFDWSLLLDIKVWYFATIQMFFSTQLGFGNLTTCAGKLYSKNNAFWTAVYYVVTNLVVGIIVVFIVFLWIGQIEATGHVVDSPEFPEAFVYTLAYNVANYCMDVLPRLWSSLAFLAFICAGFTTMIALLYTVIVGVVMEIRKWEWWHIAGCTCVIGFVAGIFCLLPHQLEIVHILDHYVIGRMVLASTTLEIIGFAWIYGCGNLYNDFEFLLGQKLNPLWKCIWIITPILLIIVEVWSFVKLPLTGFGDKAKDPVWVFALGWSLYLLTWLIVICTAIYQIASQVDYNITQKLMSSLKPSRNWGPVDTITRHRWVRWKDWSNKDGHRDYSLKRQGTKDYTASIRKGITPLTTYRMSVAVSNGTLQNNRATDKGPFKIQANGTEHFCWRGKLPKDDVNT